MAPFIKSRSLEKKGGLPSSSSSAVNANAVGTTTDDFSARRSSRVDPKRYTADNDTWVEALAVCEIPVKPGYGDKPSGGDASSSSKKNGGLFRKFKSNNGSNQKAADDAAKNDDAKKPADADADVAAASQRLTLRPYFQSRNTGQRVWDEPPSGASEILYATPEARRMAQAQLEEMRSTYAHAAAELRRQREEKRAAEAASSKKPDGGGNKLTGLPKKVFGKRSSASGSAGTVDTSQSSSLLGHDQRNNSSNTKPAKAKGSLVLSDEGGRGGIPKSILQESKKSARASRKSAYEADLQKAMLMSMELGGGSVMGVGEHNGNDYGSAVPPSQQQPLGGVRDETSGSGMTREEEEQLAMATALSLSEQETRQGRSTARSKSSSYRRNKSDSDDSDNVGYLPLSHMEGSSSKPRKSRSSSRTKKNSSYANATSNMKPRLSDFDDFDGGGKMPAQQRKGVPEDFGNRGPSWELEWNQSSSSLEKKKDWGMC